MVAIGIDLGTTNSCVAVWRRGRVEVIANDLGDRITPSCVAFDEEERFIGKPAILQTTKNPRNTVYEVKRLIGRNFNDPLVQGDMKNWPFLVVDVEGSPRIQVEYLLESKVLAPEEISAMVLGKLKDTAEKFLDCEVTDAVITVPAYFTNAQREATIDAGKIAGLNVLRIINEPTAAALAYGLNTTQEEKRTVLIYDLGGGTFDVSIVRIEHGPKIEVLATNGDTHLGGSDFDNLIVEHLAVIFQDESGKDVRENAKSRYKLRREVEAAKVLLSTNYQANIYIDALMDGADFDHTITLATFEELCSTLIRSTIVHVENAMKDAKLLKSGIDEVVLVGGSTRIPMVRQLLREFFAGKALKEDINCDEAVAYGAAVQAAILSGEAGVDFQDLTFTDVTPMSLGTEVYGGYMDVVVPKNTRIPCSVSKKYCTVSDNQTRMESRVFEGEKKMVRDNNFLGNYIMTGIPPAKANVGCTLDTFHINENNILTVTSVEQITRKKESITIRMEKRRLPVKERERMTEDAETYRREDQRNNERDEAEHLLESMTLRERD